MHPVRRFIWYLIHLTIPTDSVWVNPVFIIIHFSFGYLGYNQIEIAPENQEKTTFTCPYGTFAVRRMPFGLCNTPATFQRCMMSMFSDLVEEVMEIFMDDFTVYGSSFEQCLNNLETVLQRCKEK